MSNQETGVAWEFIKRAILPTRPVYRVIVGVAAFFGVVGVTAWSWAWNRLGFTGLIWILGLLFIGLLIKEGAQQIRTQGDALTATVHSDTEESSSPSLAWLLDMGEALLSETLLVQIRSMDFQSFAEKVMKWERLVNASLTTLERALFMDTPAVNRRNRNWITASAAVLTDVRGRLVHRLAVLVSIDEARAGNASGLSPSATSAAFNHPAVRNDS